MRFKSSHCLKTSVGALIACVMIAKGQSPTNPWPADGGDYSPPPEEPCCPEYCANQDDGSPQVCQLPICEETGSVYFSIGLGRTGFERKTDYFRAAAGPSFVAPRPGMPNSGVTSGMAHKVRDFEHVCLAYRRSPLTARRPFRVWIAQDNIDADTYKRSALIPDREATAEKILDANGIRQVLTDDRFTDIQDLSVVRASLPSDIQAILPSGTGSSEGYVIRTWFSGDEGAKTSGLYTLPGGVDPLAYVIFYNPDAPADNGRLNIVTRAKFNGTSYKTRTYCHDQNSSNHNWLSSQFDGLPSTSPLRQTTLNVISWANSRDFTRVRTLKEATLSPDGTLGALATISVTSENFDDVGGTSRMVEETKGYGTSYARTTRYGYYDNPADAGTLGRLKWRCNPDGSFEYYQISLDPVGSTGSIVKYTSWRDYKWDPDSEPSGPDPASSFMETTYFTPSTLTVNTQVAGQTVGYRTEELSTDTDGTKVILKKDWYDGSHYLTAAAGYYPETAVNFANRIKWREFQDGTAENYSYTAPDGAGMYVQTVERGAGTRAGIASGRRVASTRNRQGMTIEEHTYHFDASTTIELHNWVAESTTVDYFGRPTKRIWNADTNDFDQTVFGCCGIASSRDRKGIVTEPFQDSLNRVRRRTVTSGSRVVTTDTDFNGLVTTTRRKSGALDVLVSKKWLRTNGEMEKTQTPDENNDGNPEETAYTYSFPTTGGLVFTTMRSDGSTKISEYFTDGQLKCVTGTAVADKYYDHGTHNLNGGGLTSTETRPTASSSAGEWRRFYADRIGRMFRTEYPTQIRTSGTLDHADTVYYDSSAAAGARGREWQTTDADGVTKTYGYDLEGNLNSITEPMPGSVGNRVTFTTSDAVSDPDLGPCTRRSTTVNGVLVSTELSSGDGYAIRTTSAGRVTTRTRHLGSAGTWVDTVSNPDSTRTREIYANGLLQSTERRDNTTSAGGLGNLVSSLAHSYDGLGRTLSTTDSRTGTTNYTSYTESGNLLSATDPGNRTTTFSYDARGRRTQVDHPDTAVFGGGTVANITSTSYYPNGKIKAVWGDQSYASFYVYDEQNRMTEVRTYQGLAHGMEPTSLTGGAQTTSWSYHPQRGWLLSKEFPDGQDAGTSRDPGPAYTYTAAGRLNTCTWGRGKRTRYDYRQGYLVSKRHFTSAGADTGSNAGNDSETPDAGFSYNAFGQLLTAVTSFTTNHPAVRNYYYYDTAATLRMTRELFQIDPDMTFTLGATSTGISVVSGATPPSISRFLHRKADALLRNTGVDLRINALATSTLEVGSTIGYDAEDGRLASVTGDFAGSTETVQYEYVPDSNADLVASQTRGSQVMTNLWETTRNVHQSKDNTYGGSTVTKYAYGMNEIGQRTSVTATGSAFPTAPDWDWGYNANGELVSSRHLNTGGSSRYYAFDGIGNRTEQRDGTHTSSGGTATSYTPNALNQYDTIGMSNPYYDVDGNMTSGPLPAASGGDSTLVWDGNNRLIQVTPYGRSPVNYHYDAFCRRVAKTEEANRTYWCYDRWNPIAEYIGLVHTTGTAPAITLEKTWMWGLDVSGSLQGAGGVGGLVAAAIEAGSDAGVYFPNYDGSGNIGEYLNTSGSVVARYEYDGFGRTLLANGTLAALFEHRFSTKPLDADTGLYYYGYRYYDCKVGKWLSRDPLNEIGGINVYNFIRNGGANTIDMLGLQPKNPDGSNKELCQQYEEIEKSQRNQEKEGKIIDSIEKSKQRDKRELKEAADRALEGDDPYDDDDYGDPSDASDEEDSWFLSWVEETLTEEVEEVVEDELEKRDSDEPSNNIIDPSRLMSQVKLDEDPLEKLEKEIQKLRKKIEEARREAEMELEKNVPGVKEGKDALEKLKDEIDGILRGGDGEWGGFRM